MFEKIKEYSLRLWPRSPFGVYSCRADRLALEEFTQNFYLAAPLGVDEARNRVESGVVEIVDEHGAHISNGILVTSNGYFLTADHCVKGWSPKLWVRLAGGRAFAVSGVCRRYKTLDIALAKAKIPSKPNPMLYKFFCHDEFPRVARKPIGLLSRWDGKIEMRNGFTNGDFSLTVKYDTYPYKCTNLALCSMGIWKGDSGGAIVTVDGEIVGIMSGGDFESVAYISSWYNALGLVLEYSQTLGKK